MVKKAGLNIVTSVGKKIFKPKKIKAKLKVVKTTKPKTTKPKTTKPKTTAPKTTAPKPVFRPPNAKGLKERVSSNTLPKGRRVSTVVKKTNSQKVLDAIKRNPKKVAVAGTIVGGAAGASAIKATGKGKPIKRKTGTFK
tara:strand:+ start:952 stop:1368 length:417 start_codon:yes stop_codon:yes gene_type:complete